MSRFFLVVSVLSLLGATAALAQSSFPKTLEEAGKTFDPNAPKTETPPPPPPPPPPNSTTTTTPPPPPPSAPGHGNEPAEVDGWKIIELKSERYAPDPNGSKTGSKTPTMEACGYERDVIVERTHPPGEGGKLQTTPAVLVMPCAKGADGLPTPGMPSLKLPPPYGAPQASGAMKMASAAADIEVGVSGDVAQKAVVDVVLAHRAELDACHTMGKGGLLVTRVVVGATGKATEAAREGNSPLANTTTEKCVATAVKSWPWPKPGDGHPAVVAVGVTFTDKMGTTTALTPPSSPVCKDGEKPKKAEELKPGEVSCIPAAKAPQARPCAQGEEPKPADQLGPGELACKQKHDERGVPFLKGELSHLGDVQLVNSRSSFGVGLGLSVIDSVYFAVVRPDLNIKFGDFGLGLGAPLRFELADLSNIDLFAGDPVDNVFGDFGRFRTEDWDQIEDLVRPLRYLTWGRKEDHLYIDINRVHATTVGHGQLVRRYAPNLDIDEDNLFAQVDGYGDYGGVELMGGPFPVPRLVGGLVFIKPMGIVQAFAPLTQEGSYANMVADSWSIGASYVTDLNSPTGLEGRFNPADSRFQLAVDPANQLIWRNKANPIGDVVQGIGVDTEVKVLKIDNVDVKVYADYSHLFFPADSSTGELFEAFDGGGATVGGLLRVSLGETPVRPIEEESDEVRAGKVPREKKAAHAFRVRLEGRTFAPTYLPSYWNTMYEVDRFQFGFSNNRATLPTKIGFLASKKEAPWRAGYFLEASYAWVDAAAVTVAFEDAYPLGEDTDTNAKNLALHVETQGLGWLQLFASYHYRNFDFDTADKLFQLSSDNEILYAGLRLQVLPIMFINVAAQRSFRVAFGEDDQPGQFDDKQQRFTSIGLQNATVIGADVELGWQF